MTSPARGIHYSFADYLALEASSNVKHEFLEGQIYGMAGGTPEHAALAASVTGLLFAQTRAGRCRVHGADLRVRVLEQVRALRANPLALPVRPRLSPRTRD